MDDGSIQGEDDSREIRIAFFVTIKLAGATNQHLSHSGEHSPIAPFVGLGKVGSCQVTPEPKMILQTGPRVQAGNDVAQAFSIGQLAKTEGQEMIVSRKTPRTAAHRKLFNTPAKSLAVEAADNLGKYGFKDRSRRFISPLKRESITHTLFTKPAPNSHSARLPPSLTGH